MDIGLPIIGHHWIDVRELQAALGDQDELFWAQDQPSRVFLAKERPGRSVFYYNEQPHFVRRAALRELDDNRQVSVLRNTSCPMFEIVDTIIQDHILPLYGNCDVMRVQLAELPAGRQIGAHRDIGILAAAHRLHLPIDTNEAVVFTIDDEEYFLQTGTLYELNNIVRHSVNNNGTSARTHLLIDLIPRSIGRALYFDDRKAMALACLK